ncbi:MAG: trehalose-phosphatase [Sphingomonadaceae bacterium]
MVKGLASAGTRLAPPPRLDPAADALFLDFDGTLAAIAPTPDAVTLSPGMRAALADLPARLSGRVAIVSGRPVAALLAMLGFDGLHLVGVHGLEQRAPFGQTHSPAPAPGLAEATQALEALASRAEGLLVERKRLSVALHYRLAPAMEPQARAAAEELAERHGLALQTGKMVLELRTPGADKGSAVTEMMGEPPFRGFRPVFVGDDDTDEHAFAAVARLGGHGIRVGTPAGETSAAHALADVEAVAAWLRA